MDIDYCKLGLAVIESEAQAVARLSDQINENFSQACELLHLCKGRIIVTGVGKSGHVANKLAATLASTGSPAFFVHAGEALHGDFGMVCDHDVIIAISNSGANHELVTLLPLIKRHEIPLIALTGKEDSPLAKAASVTLNVGVEYEACPLNLAPTSSTTAAMAMGDALAVALLKAKGFSAEDFALSHPGGQLGRKLLIKVDDICHQDEALPRVDEKALISEALIEITEKKLGVTCITDKHNKLKGIFTDGDVRRAFSSSVDIHQTSISEVMTRQCSTITMGALAIDALNLMKNKKITSLAIINNENQLLGVVHMHDIIRAGVV